MRRLIDNFELIIGDLAVHRTKRGTADVLEVAMVANPDLRGFLTRDATVYICGNLPDDRIEYILHRVQQNLKFLGV